jgi:pimeloyl-ACP methyl ester carboxylesterase
MRHILRICIGLCLLGIVTTGCRKDPIPDTPSATEETRLVSVIEERDLTTEEIKKSCDDMTGGKLSSFPIQIPWHPVRKVTLKYRTTGVDGNPMEASGVVIYRTDFDSTFRGLCSVQHGTCPFHWAPSLLDFSPEAAPALAGYIVVEADYIGYGISQTETFNHPYLHTTSTAQACYDMLLAAREYLEKAQIGYHDQTLLAGVSQGGNASVALLEKLEKEQYPNIGEVFAAGPPLSITTIFTTLLADSLKYSNYTKPSFALQIIRSMNECHHLNLDWSLIFKPPYHSVLGILDSVDFYMANSKFTRNMREVFHEDFFAPDPTSQNSELAKLFDAFQKNDLVPRYHPQHRVQLFHTPTDEIIPYQISVDAVNSDPNYTLSNLSSKDHLTGCLEFYIWLVLVHLK